MCAAVLPFLLPIALVDSSLPTRTFTLPLHELLNQLMQRCQFFGLHQLELVYVVNEMLKTGVQVRLSR